MRPTRERVSHVRFRSRLYTASYCENDIRTFSRISSTSERARTGEDGGAPVPHAPFLSLRAQPNGPGPVDLPPSFSAPKVDRPDGRPPPNTCQNCQRHCARPRGASYVDSSRHSASCIRRLIRSSFLQPVPRAALALRSCPLERRIDEDVAPGTVRLPRGLRPPRTPVASTNPPSPSSPLSA